MKAPFSWLKDYVDIDISAEELANIARVSGAAAIVFADKYKEKAEGAGKKEILKKAVFGKITTQVPASLLQLHPNVTIIEATGLED